MLSGLIDRRRRAVGDRAAVASSPARGRSWSLACIVLAAGAAAVIVSLLCQPSGAGARIATRPSVHYCNSHGRPPGCVHVPKAAKRPPTSVNEQGGPTLTPPEVADGGGLGGGPDEGRASALEWAHTQL